MDLVFSCFTDSGAWPEHPGAGHGAIDQEVVGPLRLLDHIETMLGLGGPEVSSVERVAIYGQKVKAAGPNRFWSESFALDPWSSARELLGWRDQLIETGWVPGLGIERTRFADLSAAEEAGPALPSGMADRLWAAINELDGLPTLPLQRIRLIDERTVLPVGWRILLDHLESCGVVIEQLSDGSEWRSGEDRLALLTADTEIVAAEALAAWLSSTPGENGDLVFVLGGNTSLLDHALTKAGLPRFGSSVASPHRSILQVLPLSFALAWEPPDPKHLLDFLLLPLGPVPHSIANKLAEVVAASPGVGGDDWKATWKTIEEEMLAEEGVNVDKVGARLAEWREFIEPERHDPVRGMPRAAARRIVDKVSAWSIKRAGASDDPLFLSLAKVSADLATAIAVSEGESFDRILIERMIEEAIGPGVTDPSAIPEAAPWRAVHHPGAIWGDAGAVVWWHFTDIGETNSTSVWNAEERAALTEAGCPLDEPELALKRLAAAWERPLRFGRNRIVLVRPGLVAGAAPTTHPLWHSLVAGRPSLEAQISVRAEAILSEPRPTLIDRMIVRSPVTLFPPPEQRAEWTAAKGMIHRTSAESATSLSALLSCPLQWTLRYAGKIYPGVRQSLPNLDNLVGTLAHRIAQDILQPGAPPEPEVVEAEARRRLSEFLPQIAATLLLPGAAGELEAARDAVPQALGELARFLRSQKLSVIGVEYPFEVKGSLGAETEVKGWIDVLARSPSGRLVVIDLKWQRRDTRRRAELENGVAIQLSVYARHVTDEKVEAEAGFFMLRQRRFLTTDTFTGDTATVIDGPSPKETWDRIASSWKETMAQIKEGKVRATSEQEGTKLADFKDDHLLIPPSCGFCDYAGICGVAS